MTYIRATMTAWELKAKTKSLFERLIVDWSSKNVHFECNDCHNSISSGDSLPVQPLRRQMNRIHCICSKLDWVHSGMQFSSLCYTVRMAKDDNVCCTDGYILRDEEFDTLPYTHRTIYLSVKWNQKILGWIHAHFRFRTILLTVIDDWSSTEWQSSWHTWLPHFSLRPHLRWQDDGVEFQQGQRIFSWPPRHTTGTFTSHRGCGSLRISIFSVWISHGPAGRKFLSTICTLIASWHLAVQRCSHPVVSLASRHGWTHVGQSFMWHLCSFVWWHFDAILHGNWHFGAFVFFSRPHGTVIAVLLHLQFRIQLIDETIFLESVSCNNLPAFDLRFQLTRIALALMTWRCTFVFLTRQHLATNFIARRALTIATLYGTSRTFHHQPIFFGHFRNLRNSPFDCTDVYCNHEFVCISLRTNTASNMEIPSNAVRTGISSRQSPDIDHSHLDDNVRHKYDCHIRVSSDRCSHTGRYLQCTAPVIPLCRMDMIVANHLGMGRNCRHDISLCICDDRSRTICCTICHNSKSNCHNSVLAVDCHTHNSAYSSSCTADIYSTRDMVGCTRVCHMKAFASTGNHPKMNWNHGTDSLLCSIGLPCSHISTVFGCNERSAEVTGRTHRRW